MKSLFCVLRSLAGWLLVSFLLMACGASRKSTSHLALQPEPESRTGRISNQLQYEKKIRRKYADYIGIAPEQIQNMDLFTFIDQWLYTPYKYAGTTKEGVDCSGFVQRLLADVYHHQIVRKSSAAFYKQNTAQYRQRQRLNEGDVLFFQTGSGKEITHMGLYVGNRMFVHASSTYGVSIASLDNTYWQPRYAGAGRVIEGSR